MNIKLNKIVNLLIVIAFFVIIIVPLATLNTKEDAVSSIDNRMLAQNPFVAYKESNASLTDSTDAYISDRIGFREDMIEIYNEIVYHAFGISGNPSVIVGKDGWLYYNSEEDDRRRELYEKCFTVKQYLGTEQYSDEQLQQIADNLLVTRKFVESQGAQFIVFIAPNKERVYDQYMPDYLANDRVSDTCNTDQLVEYLEANTDLDIVYPREEFKTYIQENPETPIYYKLDTHWNDLGAYIGVRSLLEKCNLTLADSSEVEFSEKNITSGDLSGMMGLTNCSAMSDINIVLGDYPNETMETISEYNQFKNKGKDDRRIFVVGDSFRLGMEKIIGSEFDESYFMHVGSFNIDEFMKIKPDIFVYECAERYDDRLLSLRLENTD